MLYGRRMMQMMNRWVFGKTPALTGAGAYWLSLHVGDPGDDGQSNRDDLNWLGYERDQMSPGAWSNPTLADPSVVNNSVPVEWGPAIADWAALANFTHVGVWTDPVSHLEEHFVGRYVIGVPSNVPAGQTMTIDASTLISDLRNGP